MPCTLEVVPGVYHGFDASEGSAQVCKDFRRAQLSALDAALNDAA